MSGDASRRSWPGRRPVLATRNGAARSRTNLVALCFALLSALAAGLAGAQEGRAYFELNGGFRTGDFGTTTRSDLLYLAPTFGYAAPRYDYSVTVPYLSLTSRTASGSTTQSGIGDTVARGGRELAAGTDWSLYGSLAVKLPTADEERGLGTGEADLGAFATFSRDFGSVRLSLLGGTIQTGDPPAQTLTDLWLYGIGLATWAGATRLYGSIEGRTASVPGAPNPLEVYVGAMHPLSARQWLTGTAFGGLNDGGPRYGASIGFVHWF
jgi:hypothetical protein